MVKRIVLTTPEVQSSLTCHKAKNVNIDLSTGQANLVFDKCDNDGNVATSIGAMWTLSPEDLESLTQTLLTSAQASGQVPAGTIEDEE